MNSRFVIRENLQLRPCHGSILLYVLWILVLISALAFQLTSASRATTLQQSAFARQLQQKMQVESAIQFAIFKILAQRWQDRSFKFALNGQAFEVDIFNESGFVSVYETGNLNLRRFLESVGLSQEDIFALEEAVKDDDRPLRFNSFSELGEFLGLDGRQLQGLLPQVSIFHEEPVNPAYSPAELLMKFHRIDQFRVKQLLLSEDGNEKAELRDELTQMLFDQEMELSESQSHYYRVRVRIDDALHWVFMHNNRRNTKYKVLLIHDIWPDPDMETS